MKKLIAILLGMMMLMGCCVAETGITEDMIQDTGKVPLGTISINGAFNLVCGLPEGYRVQPLKMTQDQVLAAILSDDPEAPVMQLSVAFDETYSDVMRMNDLDEEAMALLESTFTAMDPTVEISEGETGLGTRLIIAKQTDEDKFNYIDFLSIYQGYFIEFVLVPGQNATEKKLTDEQLRMCITFLTDLDFVPAASAGTVNQVQVAGKTFVADLSDYDADNGTMKAVLKEAITLDPAVMADLKVGDTLALGEQNVEVETIETYDEGDVLINDELELRLDEGVVRAYQYEAEVMQTLAEMRVAIPGTAVFLDEVDPETGEMMENPTTHTAAEFIQKLSEGAETDPGFAVENTSITFNDAGELTQIQRFYVPWQ